MIWLAACGFASDSAGIRVLEVDLRLEIIEDCHDCAGNDSIRIVKEGAFCKVQIVVNKVIWGLSGGVSIMTYRTTAVGDDSMIWIRVAGVEHSLKTVGEVLIE